MACFKCKAKKAKLDFPYMEGSICEICFLKLIEKRVRRSIRLKNPFTRTDSILILDDSSQEYAVSKHLLSNILKSNELKISSLKIKSRFELDQKELKRFIRKNKITKVVLPWNLDNEIEQQLNKMFSKTKKQKLQVVKVLSCVTEQEVETFAKVKKLKGKKVKHQFPEIAKLLNKLIIEHPEIKFSTYKSFEKLKIQN